MYQVHDGIQINAEYFKGTLTEKFLVGFHFITLAIY